MVIGRFCRAVIVSAKVAGYSFRSAFRDGETADCITGLTCKLTGLKSRRALIQEFKDKSNYSVILLDVDGLRQFNEVSYSEGDRIIKRTAEVLKEAVNTDGEIYRMFHSGDEFVVLIPDTNSAVAVAKRIHEFTREKLGITVSQGIFVNNEDSLSVALTRADHALRIAKKSGKEKWILWFAEIEERCGK